MKKRFISAFLVGCAATVVWIGCGGSSSDAPASDADSGSSGSTPPTTPPNPPPPPPTDAPADAPKDAPADVNIDAPEVSLRYGSCGTFTPCGGDPTGTWKYTTGGCIDAFATPGCPEATITSPSFKVKGILTIGPAPAVSRQIQAKLTATVGVPKVCVDRLPAAFRNCASIQLGLTSAPPTGAGFDSATCTDAGGGACSCDIAKTQTDIRNGTYTLTNGNKTISTDDGKTYDFCVGADASVAVLTYRDSSSSNPLPATFVLAH